MSIEYDIREKIFPHPSGDRKLYQVVTMYPGGLSHVSSDGGDEFDTREKAEAEVERRRSRER